MLEEGGLLVGFVCAFGNHNLDRGTFIDALHVDSNYRGRGVGKRLNGLNSLNGYSNIILDSGLYLEVMSENHQAIAFYQAIGGKEELEQTSNAPCGSQVKRESDFGLLHKSLNRRLRVSRIHKRITVA